MDFGKKKILPNGWKLAEIQDLSLLEEMEKIVFERSAWARFSIQSHLEHHFAWLKEGVGYLFYVDLGDSLELLRIGILPSKRKSGEGETILRTLCEFSSKVLLEVSSRNPPALNLYHKLGFKELGIRKSYYGPGEDAILMEWAKTD
ncbi:GNAT family N-acetyltransferase [Leptospira langatensis]|uniref:GNAT family N-acetyltransferase n=1 Tax=Leptospira langatensis TaxID=2484983 RepID=A0A5F1ZUY4_9LEPT|nr:GNAT family N-acetyltransferase [Leptospira langatensis]TGK01200.1 GNAT family N-acetyltransferase [Leptospira langatensis]TGL42349.1 GNAT family N-acetyltransferase [Leptospira langatensis]